MSQCSNFWCKIDRSRPIQFLYRVKFPGGCLTEGKDSAASSAKNETSPEHQKSLDENPGTGNAAEPEPRKQAVETKNPFSEIIRPLLKSAGSEIDISASLCGRLYEDFNSSYIWKTKCGLPPTLLKLTAQSPPAFAEKLAFQIYLVDARSHDNAFYIIEDGIKGQTRKSAANGFCEFKGLKLNCVNEGEKRKMLILVYLTDPDDPATRTFLEAFLSPEIQVFSQNGKVVQIEKLEQFKQYFELFDPDVFQKSVRRTEGDLSQFYAYILKKNPKIKNLLYIVFKFPEIVSLYYNAALLPAENPEDHLCELIFCSPEVQEANQLNLVSNYLNPGSKLVIKFNCPPDELKFIINKDFTAVLSVLVGDLVEVPATHKKLQNDVKQTYIKYYRSITESSSEDEQLEDEEEEQSPYKELNLDDQESDQEAKKEKSNSKQPPKETNSGGKAKKLKARTNHKQEDSSYTSEDNREQASDLSLSNKRVRRNAYTKWLERSKKQKMKEKMDVKQNDRAQNLMKPPQKPTQLFPVIPMMGGMSGFPQPQQIAPMPQMASMGSLPGQPQLSYVMVADPNKTSQMNLAARMVAPMAPQSVSVIPNSVSLVPGGMQSFQAPTSVLTTAQPQILLSAPRSEAPQNNQYPQAQPRTEIKQQAPARPTSEEPKPRPNVQWMAQPVSNTQQIMISSPQGIIMGGPQISQYPQGQFISMQQPGMQVFSQSMPSYGISGISSQQLLQAQGPMVHVIKPQESSSQNHSNKSLGVQTRNQKSKHIKEKQQENRKPQQPSFMIQANPMHGMPQMGMAQMGMAQMGMPGMVGMAPMGGMAQMAGMQMAGMPGMAQMAQMAPMASVAGMTSMPMAAMGSPNIQFAGQSPFMFAQNGMQLMAQPGGPSVIAMNPTMQMIPGAQQLSYPYMSIIRPNDRPA